MSHGPHAPEIPQKQLTLFDSGCIIVGIIIGAGIYRSSPTVAQHVASSASLIGVFLLGGLLSGVGAACYAELTTAYPQEGGDYVFLSKAYGRWMGFLFAWAEFWIIRPGNVGAMAYIFATYALKLLGRDFGNYGFVLWACAEIVVLTCTNLLGVRTGKWTQNLLTSAKVLGLLTLFVIGLMIATPVAAVAQAPAAGQRNLPLALIFVLFTYGGWNEMSYVAAEIRDPQRNVPRALFMGLAVVATIYVLVNLVFLRVLGLDGVRQSEGVAAEIALRGAGRWGDSAAQGSAAAISLLICISCLGAINGMIFTGSRIYYAVGTDHRLFAWLGRWSGKRGVPVRSLTLQAVISLFVVVIFGSDEQQFERLVVFTTPFFYFFLLLTGLSLIVLRFRDPATPRIYRVTLYPLPPLLLCAMSLFVLKSSLSYALSQGYAEGYWAVGVMIAGVAVYCVSLMIRDHSINRDE